MKKQLLCIVMIASAFFGINSHAQWSTIANDAVGDGNSPALMDGTALDYLYDEETDVLSFRITTADITSSQSMAVGVNVMVNYPGGGSTFNFWGFNNGNPYHRLLTAWVTGSPTAGYSGTIGISDASGVSGSNYTSLSSNNIDISVNTSTNEITLELDRVDLIPDNALGQEVLVAAAVGSNASWNDDIYSATGKITLPGEGAILIESILVEAEGGVTSLTTGTTLQMNASVLPALANSEAIAWSVTNETGEATIGSNGLLTAVLNGDVTVTATATDGSNISGSATISIAIPGLGFNEYNINDLQVYPNPAQHYIMLNNKKSGIMKIYAQDGKLVLVNGHTVSGEKVDISSLTQGVYYIVITSNSEVVYNSKFMKR